MEIFSVNRMNITRLIFIAIALIMVDMVITIIGIVSGLEELNFIVLMFMRIFGDFYGLIVSAIVKCAIVIFPMIVYRYVEKKLKVDFLKYVYWQLYTALIVITIITTLTVNINNITIIIDQFGKLEYV